MKTLINYIRDTKAEMKHVSWPTKKQTTAYTVLVIVLSIALSIYLGIFDFIFTEGISLTV
jgi:preprotein translocase subunit SecE